MHLITVFLRIALSGVFGVAGVTKLIDPRGTRDAVKNFGAPEPLVPAVSLALPIVELAIAAGLLFTDTSRDSEFYDRQSQGDRKSTRLNSSHLGSSYPVFCLKEKKTRLPSR